MQPNPRLPAACFTLLAATLPTCGDVAPINQGILTLVNEAGYNSMNVRLDIPLFGSQTRTSTITGTVLATLAIDPATNRTPELSISDGVISGTPVSFSMSVFLLGSVKINSSTIGGTAFTTTPPGPVDPPTGNFDATLHQFVMNQGTLTGTAVGSPVDINLANDPFTGTGKGTGNAILVRGPDTATRANYTLTMILPIDFTNPVSLGTVRFTGNMKATGQISVPLSDYLAWTESQGTPGANPAADANADGVADGLSWALGLGLADDPRPHLLRPSPSSPPGFTLTLPAGGSAAPLFIEASESMAPDSWVPADPAGLSLPANPLPAGTTGTITVAPSPTLPARFLRLRAQP